MSHVCGHTAVSLGKAPPLLCDLPTGHAGLHEATEARAIGSPRYRWGEPAKREQYRAERREQRRLRQRVNLVLSDEERAILDRLAGQGGSRSAVVGRLLLAENARKPRAAHLAARPDTNRRGRVKKG